MIIQDEVDILYFMAVEDTCGVDNKYCCGHCLIQGRHVAAVSHEATPFAHSNHKTTDARLYGDIK